MPVPEALRSFGAFGAFGESPGAGAFAVPGSRPSGRPALNLQAPRPPTGRPLPLRGPGCPGLRFAPVSGVPPETPSAPSHPYSA